MMMMMMMMMTLTMVSVRSVRMLSRGQSYEIVTGQNVQLQCQFYADSFNLFDYPVVWHKRQHYWPPHQLQHLIHHHHYHYQQQQQQQAWLTGDAEDEDRDPVEDCQVNMMGNLLEPFASFSRYQATFIAHPPRYLFGLSITGWLPTIISLRKRPRV